MARQEMPIFTRTFDFLQWLLPVSNHFPRAHRHNFTQRLLDAAFDLRERLEEANLRRGLERQERLQQADESLAKVRLYLRLAARLDWLSGSQYRHVSAMVSEIGRLLGVGFRLVASTFFQATFGCPSLPEMSGGELYKSTLLDRGWRMENSLKNGRACSWPSPAFQISDFSKKSNVYRTRPGE